MTSDLTHNELLLVGLGLYIISSWSYWWIYKKENRIK
jgi:hypothetical protein